MANRYFAGNTLASFFRSSTAIVEITTAGYFDSTYVPNAISLPGGGSEGVTTASYSATGTVQFHFELRLGNTINAGTPFFRCLNGSTNGYQLTCNGAGTVQFWYWNGSAFVSIGTSTLALATGALNRIDVKIVLGTSVEVYIGGSPALSASLAGGPTTLTRTQFWSPTSTASGLSQVMISDYDMRDSKYKLSPLTGNSAANTNGTGAYTDVNETVLDESTYVTLTTSTHKKGFTRGAIGLPTGYVIAAMVQSARGRATGAITDGKFGIRSAGINYSSSGRSFNGGYEPRVLISDSDPATATRFTEAGFDAAETYLEAA